MIRWPAGIVNPGRQWNKSVSQVDLLATFADLLETELPDNAGEDSQSFVTVLFDPDTKYNRLPLINHGNNGRYSITDGDWKWVSPGRAGKGEELYNLAEDRQETNNLAAKHPEKCMALKKKITQIVVQGRTTPGTPQSNDTGYWKDLTWMTNAEYDQGSK